MDFAIMDVEAASDLMSQNAPEFYTDLPIELWLDNWCRALSTTAFAKPLLLQEVLLLLYCVVIALGTAGILQRLHYITIGHMGVMASRIYHSIVCSMACSDH